MQFEYVVVGVVGAVGVRMLLSNTTHAKMNSNEEEEQDDEEEEEEKKTLSVFAFFALLKRKSALFVHTLFSPLVFFLKTFSPPIWIRVCMQQSKEGKIHFARTFYRQSFDD